MRPTAPLALAGLLIAGLVVTPTASAAEPKCNGFWYYEETFGPVTVWTDGSPECTGVEVDDDVVGVRDIYVPEFMGCTWSGSYKPYVSTPVVTVWVYTCDPPT